MRSLTLYFNFYGFLRSDSRLILLSSRKKKIKAKHYSVFLKEEKFWLLLFFPLKIHLRSLFYSSQLLEETEGEGGADVPFYAGMRCELNFQESESFTYVGKSEVPMVLMKVGLQ